MASGVERSRRVYRGRLEIIRDMLLVVNDGGSKKTHIMYKANLSYKLLKNYLEYVLTAGLVEYDGKSYYLITEKGRMFLGLYDAYEKISREVEENINSLEHGKKTLEKMLTANEGG